MKLEGPQFWYETVYNGLALEDDEEPKLPEAIASIRTNAETIYNAYQVLLNHARPNIPTPSSPNSQSSKRIVGERGLSVWMGFKGSFSSSSNDFSQLNELEVYLSQQLEEVNPDGIFDILQLWKDKEKYFSVLSRTTQDNLTIQSSTVASKSTFSQSRLQIGDHR
ncbi:uncharacterized protein [Nicotiana tomentosiformis]|uniref:uncharacterized protein n=1 Tax=Nicotiana tomentosiformis TaxID=4098 RepID=UPI00388CC938